MTDAARTAPGGRADLRVHAVLLLVQVAFALLAVEGKLAMSPGAGVEPAALAMARLAGGAAVIVPFASASGARPWRAAREAPWLLLLALLGVVLNQYLFLRGLSETSPVSASLLVATIPVFAAALSALLGRERIGARTLIGLVLACAGIGTLSGFALPARGDSLVLLNALSYALYLALAPPVIARHGSRSVTAWLFSLGALLFVPVGGPALARGVAVWPARAWALVGFVVLVPTVLAYLGNAWALRRATPAQVAAYIYLQPPIAALVAWAQLGEAPTARLGVAAALVLGGVALVVGAGRAGSGSEPADEGDR